MKKNKGSFFNEYLGGDVFSKKTVIKQMPFVLYVVFLLMLYITNTYIAEDINREVLTKTRLLDEKHVEYMTIPEDDYIDEQLDEQKIGRAHV